MDGDFMVTAYVVIDKTMAALGHQDDARAGASDAEVLTVAIVAAKYFQGHLARALQLLHLGRTCRGRSASRASTAACTGWPTGWAARRRPWARCSRPARRP